MTADLSVPPEIERIIQRFELGEAPFTEFDVQQAIGSARSSLKEPNEADNLGAWAEALAFGLIGQRIGRSPWNTFFAPIGSGTAKDGTVMYFPDIAGTPPHVLTHWSERAHKLQHPILKSRYADLVWDMSPAIGKMRRDVEMARIAIDAYLASATTQLRSELHDRFEAVLRALDLACQINDSDRLTRARAELMDLHREGVKLKQGDWWLAFDRLMHDKKAGTTDHQRNELIADLESLAAYFSDNETPEKFNPHACRDAAERLIKHYVRTRQFGDAKRLHALIARTFEQFASLANAMLASSLLQTSMDAYRKAGLLDESRRIRILMQQKIGESRAEMAPIQTEVKISKDDIEKFLDAVVIDDIGSTFVRIAVEFLPKRRGLEQQVQETLQEAPLMAHITQTIMADDHVAAIIESVEDDPFGRLVHQAKFSFGFSALWLQHALDRTLEKHAVFPEHFVGWANRHGLFDDMSLLLEGVRAWYEGDMVKAVHVIVPQVEHGLRNIVSQLGRPVTKAHPTVLGASVAIGMGDILYSQEIADALGPDLTLYFLSLYADPRGLNLRNEVAHGLLGSSAIGGDLANLLIHTLLVLGLWKELPEKRR